MKTPPSSRKRAAGFNLVEMLTVITLVAILTGIGVPSYRYVTYSNRVSTEINGLLGDMQLARTEAMKRGIPVSVCQSADGATCTGTAASWERGWLVFTDLGGDGTVTAADNDAILRVQQKLQGNTPDTLAINPTTVSAITFNRSGLAINLPATADVLFSLHTTPASNKWVRCLDITVTGMMTTLQYGMPTIGITTATCS